MFLLKSIFVLFILFSLTLIAFAITKELRPHLLNDITGCMALLSISTFGLWAIKEDENKSKNN